VLAISIVLALALIGIVPFAHAQLMINKGATIVTKTGSTMQVNGAYQNNTGSIDDSGTVTITTDFENDAAATAGGSGIYYIGGNYTNNGTFVDKTGTVNLDGTSNQNVGGTAITTFYNLQFTNGGSKTLTQEEIVDSNCYFTSGICYTTQSDILHFTVNGNWVNNSGMPVAPCISYVDGPCEKATNSTNFFQFPVGQGGRANTCAITPNSSTATTYQTEYFETAYVNTTSMQSPLVEVSKIQYWFGNISSGSGSDAIIRLYWIPGDYTLASYMSTPSNLVVARWDSAAPNPPGPTPAWLTAGVSNLSPGANYNSGWIESALVPEAKYGTSTINRPFTLGSLTTDNSLPVEMGPFTARQVADHVELDWKTYSEIQSLGFELDRASGNGQPQVIQSFVNTPALQAKSPYGADYQTIDNDNLTSGQYTYSLYQIDKDGIRTSAGTQTLDFSEIAIPSSLTIAVYPNPVFQNAIIEVALPQDMHIEINIYDITGKMVKTVLDADLTAGPHLVPFDASLLARGEYNVIVSSPGRRMLRTIVVE
jgi:hypothetical protein